MFCNSPADRKTLVGLLHQKGTTMWQHPLFQDPHILKEKQSDTYCMSKNSYMLTLMFKIRDILTYACKQQEFHADVNFFGMLTLLVLGGGGASGLLTLGAWF